MSPRLLRNALLAACLVLPAAAALAGDLRPDDGLFLVADDAMPDPRFRESVILIVNHDADPERGGTFGLMINRPAGVAVRDALEGLPDTISEQHRLYHGGPVEPLRTMFLVRDRAPDDTAVAILEDVYLDTRREALVQALDSRGDKEVRVIAGYAGWGPGQLEREIEQGGWRVVRSGADSVFSDDPRGLWRRLHRASDEQLLVEAGGVEAAPAVVAGR